MNVDSNSESNGLRRSVGHGLGTDVSLDHLTELAHSEDEVIRVAVALHPARPSRTRYLLDAFS